MMNGQIRCPAWCFKIIDDKGTRAKGMLSPSPSSPHRFFCTTPGCKFAYRDEHNRDHWVGEIIPLNLPTCEPI